MVIKEMKAQVAWPESCFQAPTAESCQNEIQKWLKSFPEQEQLTISEAIIIILKTKMNEATVLNLASLGPLNLFAFVTVSPEFYCVEEIDLKEMQNFIL